MPEGEQDCVEAPSNHERSGPRLERFPPRLGPNGQPRMAREGLRTRPHIRLSIDCPP